MEFKRGVIEQFKKEIQERMVLCENLLSDLKDDISNETKSSAGDKFETSREMMQQEREKTVTQLQRLKRTLIDLDQISATEHNKVGNGSLIRSGGNYIFFLPGLGNTIYKGQKVFTAAINSPLGQELKGKGVSVKIKFRGKEYPIDEIC